MHRWSVMRFYPRRSATSEDSADNEESEPRSTTKAEKLDAGLKNLDHYKQRLPSWRYTPRTKLISFVRMETPYLAWMQDKVRCPALDAYFSLTANLGTHTFYMLALPILFWCGYTDLGRAMIHLLASGVFFSGVLKDLLCLPRPLSPPLQRISMSRSAPLEYGFPSTHATNAVSVVVYVSFNLSSPSSTIQPGLRLLIESMLYLYAISIILGRLYCGMHGFSDVVIGGLLGAVLSLIECWHGDNYAKYLYTSSAKAPLIVILTMLVLVRIHPEPADDCPCFDDSVAFAGVVCGIEAGNWHFAQTGLSWDYPAPATVPFQLEVLGWPIAIGRILLGVIVILMWRSIMKSALLKGLPPVFRIIEKLGLSLPRRFFMQASEYKKVPSHLKDDKVIPSVSDIPSFLSSIRHPNKNRAISVGPQSEADAYEAMAFREKRRKESTSSAKASGSIKRRQTTPGEDSVEYFDRAKSIIRLNGVPVTGLLPTPNPSRLDLYEDMMAAGPAICTPITPDDETGLRGELVRTASQDRRQDEKENREMFSRIEKPRVRYDVEVVTKLIVYAGIGWIASEGGPLLFALVGLGMRDDAG